MDYNKLVSLYRALEKTSKRLEKTFLLSEFLKKAPKDSLKDVCYLIQGRVYPKVNGTNVGMSDKLIVKVIERTTGVSSKEIEKKWGRLGDLGTVAEELLQKKKQATLFSQKLTVAKVVNNIRKVSEIEGQGTVHKKVAYIAELLGHATNEEAKYIVRTVLEQMRTGIQDGTFRDAVVLAFFPPIAGLYAKCDKCKTVSSNVSKCLECGEKLRVKFAEEVKHWEGKKVDSVDDVGKLDDTLIPSSEKIARDVQKYFMDIVQHAYDMKNDWGEVVELAKDEPNKLIGIDLEAGNPIKVMLYQKVASIEDGFEAVGKPAMVDEKIDGFRMQIHCVKGKIKLFTRRLEEVTKQFPDVVKSVKSHVKSNDFIIDAEIVGVDKKTKRSIPFQQISQRIKRKYDIKKMVKEVPVCVKAFDIIELNGDSMLKLDFKERREKLKSIVKPKKNEFELVKLIETGDVKKVENFYHDSLAAGNEGIMMKSMESVYKPGSRVGFGVKVKPVMETLDLVITGADWGEGKRAKWLSSFTVACRKGDELLDVGKVGTGIKEKSEEGVSFEEFTKELKPLITEEKGKHVKVKPKIVIEIDYEEIQKSPKYSSGYAMRFPRVIRLRLDKGVKDVSSLTLVKNLYHDQRGRHKN